MGVVFGGRFCTKRGCTFHKEGVFCVKRDTLFTKRGVFFTRRGYTLHDDRYLSWRGYVYFSWRVCRGTLFTQGIH